MATQTIVWTVLPNGVSGGKLRMSVFVSPRLTADGPTGTLAPFTDWLGWPTKPVTFWVRVNGGPEVRAEPVPGGPAPRLDLWATLFNGDTPVTNYVDQLAAAEPPPIRSWPTAQIHDFVRTEYAVMGAWHATQPPDLLGYRVIGGLDATGDGGGDRPPISKLTDMRLSLQQRSEARALIRVELDRRGWFSGGPLGDFSATEINFLLAEQFQRRSFEDNHAPGVARRTVVDPPEVPELDFHTAIGHLGDYPALLRRFGLVRDLQLPLPAPLPSGPATVVVRPEWSSAPTAQDITPVTECVITSSSFTAVPADPTRMGGGLLQLQHPDFALVEIDADAATSKLLSLAETVANADILSGLEDGFDPLPPPSLESRGFSISQADRAFALFQALNKNVALQRAAVSRSLAATALKAEDITRGFRVDVWDDVSDTWHSLCLRKGHYTFGGTALDVDDEGTIVPAHTTQLDDPTIYLHESLIRWVGYSLVAPRPGLGTTDAGDITGGDSEPGDVFDLKVAYRAAPGTLPKLRYGRTYRMRARTVDLAGNGLAVDAVPGSSPAVTGAVTYRRFEPVAAPYLLLRKPVTPGESQEQVVIRGNYDQPATGDSQRHLAPHRTAELTAEQHGMFDVPKNILNPGGISHAAYSTIAAKDSGEFDGGTPDPDNHGQPYHDVDQLKLPYLPDPLSRGAALRDLPGTDPGEIVTIDFDFPLLGKWPDALPFRLKLVDGTGRPSWDSLHRVLTVRLPRGRKAEVRYSSRITGTDRDLLGPWGWLLDWLAAGNSLPAGTTLDQLELLATKGQLWQLTPYRTLNLVHAIRQPLTPPKFTKPVAVRKIGETFAKILDKVTVDHQSTSRLDLLASWLEPVDVLSQPGPQTLSGNAVAFNVHVPNAIADSDLVTINNPHEFHDTKYRKVSYTAVATSSYAEYFVEYKTVTLHTGAPTPVSSKGIVPGTDVVTSTGAPVLTYVRDTDYTVDHQAGTVTAKSTLDGVQVRVAFVAPPITRASTETVPAPAVDVPSSARPVAAEIAYVVPTFGWERSSSGTQVASTRRGNGLRVYLRRPWYSSGAGEQLGVLLHGQSTRPSSTLERYVTTWGQDAVYDSTATTATPQVADFPLAVHPKSGLKLAESDRDATLTSRVSVAPHDVHYDPDRQLWFSDLTLAQGGSYNPFIRLALARYQPISVTGVELSTVALAQFAQLSPDRAATVVFAADPTKVQVTVTGLTYEPVSGFAAAATISTLVQTADPTLPGDLAWHTVTTTELIASSPAGTWTGTITLPAARGSQPFRLVFQEFENTSGPDGAGGGRRLTYADAVQL